MLGSSVPASPGLATLGGNVCLGARNAVQISEACVPLWLSVVKLPLIADGTWWTGSVELCQSRSRSLPGYLPIDEEARARSALLCLQDLRAAIRGGVEESRAQSTTLALHYALGTFLIRH